MKKNWKAAAQKLGAVLMALVLIAAAVMPANQAYALETGTGSLLGGVLDAMQSQSTQSEEPAAQESDSSAWSLDGKNTSENIGSDGVYTPEDSSIPNFEIGGEAETLAASSGTFGHIEIEVACTATMNIAGKKLTSTFNLTQSDLRNGNTTVTVVSPDGTEGTPQVWPNASIVAGNGSTRGATVKLTGSFQSGTKSNPYKYIISISYSVTFTDEDTGATYQVPMTLKVTTSYWADNNYCPGVRTGPGSSNWSNGNFAGEESGIDTPIGGNYTAHGDIQLVKVLSGVEADEDLVYTFAVYQKQSDGSYVLYTTETITFDVEENTTMSSTLLSQVPIGEYVIVEVDPEQIVNGLDFASVAYSTDAKTIEVTVDEQTTTVTGGTVEVLLNDTAGLTVTNTYAPSTGDLTITKNIEGLAPSEDETFSFTVTPGSDVDADDFAAWAAANGYALENGAVTVEITVSAGAESNTLTLEDLPAGTYTVTENYTGTKYTVSGDGEQITVSGQEPGAVTVTNTRNTVDVTLDKTVTGNMGDWSKEFTFTVTLSEGTFAPSDAYTLSEDGKTATVLLKHNESVTFVDVPVGAVITVIESDNLNYEVATTVTGAEDADDGVNTVSYEIPNEDTAISYTNRYHQTVETGIELDMMPYVMMLFVTASAAFFFLLRKRMNVED